MTLNIINELKTSLPHKRQKILMRMRQKNLIFFKKYGEDMGFSKLLETADVSEYEIIFNEKFLDIIEKKSGQYCHPPGDLLGQAKRLGNAYHSDWVDIMNPLPGNYGDTEHGQHIYQFIKSVYKGCSEVNGRSILGNFTLPVQKDGKLHSGPVVFLGIFHGLQILSLLEQVTPSHIALIEPDIESFLLSCYFIDYKELAKKYKLLSINVGKTVSQDVLDDFFDTVNITRRVWMRFLPVYHDPIFSKIIEQVKLRRATFEIHIPFEREVRGLVNGKKNIAQTYRYCRSLQNKIQCENVVVAGSGPSLKNDLEWLRENQEQLLIISATSTGILLNENGIGPDFHTYMELFRCENDEFQMDCPTVIYYKSDADYVKKLQCPLIYAEGGRPNIVDFKEPLRGTSPNSANLALSFARLLNPKTIYLVGMDLSVKDLENNAHAIQVLNSSFDKSTYNFGYSNREWMQVGQTNFQESNGLLKTNSYFWESKKSFELVLQKMKGKTQVYNLSDGMLIEGASPAKGKEIDLGKSRKISNMEIVNCFSALSSGDWVKFPDKGEQKLEKMKAEILSLFEDTFDWPKFVNNIDVKVNRIMNRYMDTTPVDLRFVVYYNFINDAITEWYRAMTYTKTKQESQMVYQNGCIAFRDLMRHIQWPEELKEW